MFWVKYCYSVNMCWSYPGVSFLTHAIRWCCFHTYISRWYEGLTIRPLQVMSSPVALSYPLSSTLWIRSQFKGQVYYSSSSELVLVRLDDRTDTGRLVSKPCVWMHTTKWRYHCQSLLGNVHVTVHTNLGYRLWDSPMLTYFSVDSPSPITMTMCLLQPV